MSDFKESESRRAEEVAKLEAVKALEWVRQSQHPGDLVSDSQLRSRRGTVRILECVGEYSSALGRVLQGEGDSAAALAPVAPLLRRAVCDEDGLCVLRRVSFGGLAAAGSAACAGLGGDDVVVCEGGRVGNDAPFPGAPIQAVCIAVVREAVGATTLRLIHAEAVANALGSASHAALEGDVDCELRDGRLERAPLISRDDRSRLTVQFSAALKEGCEWAPGASEAVCNALGDLNDVANDNSLCFSFNLRTNDLFVLDARRWLYAVDVQDRPDLDARFARGKWMPTPALSLEEREMAPTDSLVLRATVAALPS